MADGTFRKEEVANLRPCLERVFHETGDTDGRRAVTAKGKTERYHCTGVTLWLKRTGGISSASGCGFDPGPAQ